MHYTLGTQLNAASIYRFFQKEKKIVSYVDDINFYQVVLLTPGFPENSIFCMTLSLPWDFIYIINRELTDYRDHFLRYKGLIELCRIAIRAAYQVARINNVTELSILPLYQKVFQLTE